MILQSTYVIELIDKYVKAVPEVPIRFDESKYGIITISLPRDFNDVPDLSRVVAWHEIKALGEALSAAGIKTRIQKGDFNCQT